MEITREELISQGCIEKRHYRGTDYFENVIGEVIAKVCTKCEDVILADGFIKINSGIGGRSSACKECERKRKRKYRKGNPEKVLASKRKYREANPEKVREATRKCYELKSEEYRKVARKWREANPEKMREAQRKWREINVEKERERVRKYYRDNLEKVSADIRKWREDNPDRNTLIQQRRRARKALLPDTLTIREQADILENFNEVCALTYSKEYHMDHVIPLAIGHGGTTYENMIPLRADLNVSKSASHIFEWFDYAKEYFSLSQTNFDALITYLAEVNGMNVQEYRAYVDWCFDNPRSLDELTEVNAN